MATHFHGPVALVILSGQTESAELKGQTYAKIVGGCDVIAVYAPATLPETVHVKTAPSEAPAAGDYAQATTSAIAAGTVNATAQGGLGKSMKLVSGTAVAADRTFAVVFIYKSVARAGV